MLRLRHLILLSAGLLLTTLSVNCGNDGHSISLIVATRDDSSEDRLEHLMKYHFDNGNLVSTEIVVTHPGGYPNPCQEFPGSRIYQNRYLINDYGDIADIQTKEIVCRGGSGLKWATLKGIEGDNVVIYSEDTDEYYSYDLENQECSVLVEPGKWALPGTLSPDQNKSVTVEYTTYFLYNLTYSPLEISGYNDIWMHSVSGEKTLLGSGFYIQLSLFSSAEPTVPLIWFDNESILTQTSNGEIIILKTDGTIEPIVKINLSQEVHPTTFELGLLSAHFSTDPEGNIIYHLSYASYPDQEPGQSERSFMIDVGNKSYLSNPEWEELGHGFEATAIPDPNNRMRSIYDIRYNGEFIGQQWFHTRYAKTTDGYLAISYYERWDAGPKGVKVWSSASEKWTTIEYESPIWMDHEGLIGWIEE